MRIIHKKIFNQQLYFNNESNIRELISENIQNCNDLIKVSLTPEEQEELSMNQQQLLQILKNTLNSARSKQATLLQASELWKEYQQTVSQIESVVSKATVPEEPVSTLSGLLSNMQKVTNVLDDVQVNIRYLLTIEKNFFGFIVEIFICAEPPPVDRFVSRESRRN